MESGVWANSTDDGQVNMTNTLIDRLRDFNNCNALDTEEAADMLEFFFGRLQAHSPTMSGHCNYRFRSGWPMQYCVGNTPFEAVRNAVQELKREQARADHMLDQNNIDNAPESV